MTSEPEILRSAYREFNARHIDAVLARMQPDVKWGNGMEGGHVHGCDNVRAYWTRQFETLNPLVEPVGIKPNDRGQWMVQVHQVVHDISGNLLLDTVVYHAYLFRDGLIQQMDIVERDDAERKSSTGEDA